MNLLVKKLGVAIAILLPLFFVSCEDPGEIGLNVDPKQGTILSKYQEFVLPSTEVQFDPRSTVNSSSFQAGSYSDPDFGIVTTQSYSWLGIQSSNPIVNETAEYDSLKVQVRFSTIYGSEALDGEIEILDLYQLGDAMNTDIEYTRIDERPLGQKIGSLDLYLQDMDTLQTDSTFTFKLSDVFGQELFDKLKANDGTYENDTTFNEYFKGIALVPNGTNNKVIQLTQSSFAIVMYYHEFNSLGEPLERNYSYGLGDFKYYYINSDLSGTPLSGIQPNNQNFDPATDFRYMQAGTLIALKVDYSDLFDFVLADSNKNMVIQRARLRVGAIEENLEGSESPVTLRGYFTDDNNLWPITTDYTTSTDTVDFFVQLQQDLTPPGLYFNTQDIGFSLTDTTTYIAQMSTFVQDLYSGGYDSEDTPYERRGELLLFPPTSMDEHQSTISHVLTNHFKVHKDSIRLRVYYTVPN